ncbi:response regulator [Paraburkholderia sp. SIMBA_049]
MVNLNQIVVVVDDDQSVRRAIKRLLRSIGIVADTFPSGDEFLCMLSSIPSYRPACVILDIQMPGIDGLEIWRRLGPTSVPVIVITEDDDFAVRETTVASGAAYLLKPFDATMLIKAVEIALGGAPSP